MRPLDLFAGAGAVKVLVPVSGGKDSQACLKLAVEAHGPAVVRGLFCDTQFEHPLTYAHVEKMKAMYGVRIDTVTAGSVDEQCLKHERFPGGGARFCTEELKIWPTKWYCRALAIEQGGFEVWYGMRSDEGTERRTRYAGKVCDELYEPHEVMEKYPQYLGQIGVRFRLAVLHWSEADVKEFVGPENLNPLYPHFDRVGCFPCQAAGDPHKEKAYRYDDFGRAQYQRVIRIAQVINKPVFTSKGGQARNPDATHDGPGCMVCSI
jgi:3'-phosphoadenosine 5'-phosphosulfate sulfotransferase (PAPS reductase)/FAD synthetase